MMKKNWMVFPVILIILAGAALVTVFSCRGDDGSGPVTETYTGSDEGGKTYTVKITDNESYELFINDESISTGKVSKDGDTFTLTPNSGGEPFTVTVSGTKITSIVGAITPDDGGDPITPGEIVEIKPEAGSWTWALSDDSQPNTHITPQTIFAPGGSSRIENAQEDPVDTDRYGNKVMRPFVYTEPVMDNDGNPIEGPVYNFSGVTKVSSYDRPATEGAGWPLVGWEATPDEATLELLKTAYGYSFWIRLNSATANNWAFLTSVITDFAEEKGYEYKHYFGNRPGDSRTKNYTSSLTVGTWYKITVVMNNSSAGFNMDQDGWLYNYPPTPDPKKPFNQDAAQRIQWQIPLQHQSVAVQRSRDPYDITRGEYEFNVDFYGLELLSE